MPNKVMLIDSDPQTLRSYRKELEGHFVVLSSSRGHAAKDLFRVFRPDAVIASRLTEGFEAREFLEWVRRVPEGLGVPVWVTRSEDAPETLFFPQLSGTLFLKSPVHPVLLRVQLNWHFGLDREPRARVFET